MFDRNMILAELQYERELFTKYKKLSCRLPKMKLYAFEKNNHIYFKARDHGTVKYLGTANHPRIKAAQKRYLSEQISQRLNNNISLMENFLNNYQEFNPIFFLDQLPAAYRKPDDQIIRELDFSPGFKVTTSSHNDSFHPENLIHKTISGITVRSRVEAIIADFYTSLDIPFSYEEELILDKGVSIRPDFTIRDSLGRIKVIHEHIGMLGDEEYWNGYIWKLKQYIKNDYLPGNILLLTYDHIDRSIDTSSLKNSILWHLKKQGLIE